MTAAQKLALAQTEPAPVPQRKKYQPKDIEFSHVSQPAVQKFLTGQGKISEGSHYKVIGDTLWYIRPSLKKHLVNRVFHRDIVAQWINGVAFGNSSEISRQGSGHGRIRRTDRVNQLEVQRCIDRYMPMIPFQLFKNFKLDVTQLQIIDQGPDEDFDFGRKNREGKTLLQHFTGAMVFSIGSDYFMFDVDRNEVELKNFNCWMSKLRRPCTSIADAYDSLKPDEVRDAERFLGKLCARQGEWFFIPVQGDFTPDKTLLNDSQGWGAHARQVARLQSKGNRPHYVSEISKEGFVRGIVSHGGFEHKDIKLETWCKPVPNTAVESFQITGMVD